MKSLQATILESIVRKTSIDESIVKGHISKKDNNSFTLNSLKTSSSKHPIHLKNINIQNGNAGEAYKVKNDKHFDLCYELLCKLVNDIQPSNPITIAINSNIKKDLSITIITSTNKTIGFIIQTKDNLKNLSLDTWNYHIFGEYKKCANYDQFINILNNQLK